MNAIINDVDLADMGITVTDITVSVPEPKTTTTDIPGRDGVLDQSKAVSGRINYSNRVLTISGYVKETYSLYLQRYSNLLNLIGSDIVEIINKSEPDFIWQGRAAINYENTDALHSEISIECDVFPYKRKKTDTVVQKTLTGEATDIVCGNLAEPVVPTVETTAATQIRFKGKVFDVQAGSRKLDIVFERGDNVLNVTGTGEIKITYREGSL